MIKVMFADDEELVRSGLRAMLTGAPDIEVVAEAVDCHSVVEKVRLYRPVVALLDIKMATEDDGLRALEQLQEMADPPYTAMLTTFDLDEYISAALRTGANGFLLKDVDPEVLTRSLRDLASGGAVLDPSVAARMVHSQRDELRAAEPARELLSVLSEREREVIRLVGRGLANAEIGAELHLSEATVKGYVSTVLDKIGVDNRVQAALLAYRSGLVA